MKINETINSPHQSSRGSHKPELIVAHIADGYYEGTKAWFLNTTSATSSNYLIAQDGRICQCVPLDKMAWCNGTTTVITDNRYYGHSTVQLVRQLGGNANQYSVSIEFEGFYSQTGGAITEQQLVAFVWLIGHIRSEVQRIYGHSIPLDRRYLVGHCEINPKTKPCCPGEKFPWDSVMAKLGGYTASQVLYRVQVGAFAQRANAEIFLRDTVLPKGIEAFITPADTEGISRVQVGAFSVRSNAEAYLKQVVGLGLAAFLVLESA